MSKKKYTLPGKNSITVMTRENRPPMAGLWLPQNNEAAELALQVAELAIGQVELVEQLLPYKKGKPKGSYGPLMQAMIAVMEIAGQELGNKELHKAIRDRYNADNPPFVFWFDDADTGMLILYDALKESEVVPENRFRNTATRARKAFRKKIKK